MYKQIKISLWDAFSYYISGCAFLLSLWLQIWGSGLHLHLGGNDIPVAIIGVAGVLLPLIVGLLFEPVANKYGDVVISLAEQLADLCRKFTPFYRNSNGGETGDALESLAKGTMPDDLRNIIDPYHWCKDYLVQAGLDTPYITFLSKFGFYRNMGFLFEINAIAVWAVHGFYFESNLIASSLIFLCAFYVWRSNKFYKHTSRAVYGHYFVLRAQGKKAEASPPDTDKEQGD